MKKFALVLAVVMLIVTSVVGTAFADTTKATASTKPSNAIDAKFTTSKIYIDGTLINFDAYLIKGNNYLKLRDLAYKFTDTQKKFDVKWDSKKSLVNIVSNSKYTVTGGEMKQTSKATWATLSTNKFTLDSKSVTITSYLINGNNYLKLRDLAQLLNFGLVWDGTTSSVFIDTTSSYVADEVSSKITKDANGNMTIGGLLEYTIGSIYPETPVVTTNEHWASNYAIAAKDIFKYSTSKSLDSVATRYDLAFITFAVYNMNNRSLVDAYYNTADATKIVFSDFKTNTIKNSFLNGFVYFGIMKPISSTEFGVNGTVSEDFMKATFGKVW